MTAYVLHALISFSIFLKRNLSKIISGSTRLILLNFHRMVRI